jgi:hypothetical protein
LVLSVLEIIRKEFSFEHKTDMEKEDLSNIYIKLADANGEMDPNEMPQTILVINTHHENQDSINHQHHDASVNADTITTATTIDLPQLVLQAASPSYTLTQLTTAQKKRPSDHLDLIDDLKFENESKKSKLHETIMNTSMNASSSASNTDEIFQILSQKIAKYCQVLSDLTNCEVFFKSNLNQRSLYWGTYKMMFNYTHQGLQYDRNESLIKISGRSISNDVNNIVDELLNADNLDETTMTHNDLQTYFHSQAVQSRMNSSISSDTYNVQDTDQIVFRDLTVYADRLDENLYAQYLEKFERSRVYNDQEDNLPADSQLHDVDNLSEIDNLTDEDLYAHNDEIFMCDLCENHSYKYMLQLKVCIRKKGQ